MMNSAATTMVHFQQPLSNSALGQKHILHETIMHGTNQLQFNLQMQPSISTLETNFQKPRPIIIEKLLPVSQSGVQSITSSSRNQHNQILSVSSERLEAAMKLAKRDVKNLKRMLTDPNMNLSSILNHEKGEGENHLPDVESMPYVSEGQHIRSHPNQNSKMNLNPPKYVIQGKDQSVTGGKILAATQSQKDSKKDSQQMIFYDSERRAYENEEAGKALHDTKSKEVLEIRRLRKEIQNYINKLESVIDKEDDEIKSFMRKHADDEPEYRRKLTRSEEQAARSARMLYMLRYKVQEIQEELDQKGGQFKHTKKSKYLTKIAAAHRSAVRALQTFVNQAPLYYDLKHGLPPMYSELGLLIQQLTLLSTEFDVTKNATDFDMLPKTKKLISSWNKHLQSKSEAKRESKTEKQSTEQRKFPAQKKPVFQSRKDSVLREFLRDKGFHLKPKTKPVSIKEKIIDASQTSNEPTPEREAVLQAGIDAIRRAKGSASYIEDFEEASGGVRFEIPNSIPEKKDHPKSVLFPHRIKKQRAKKTYQKKISNKIVTSGNPMRFAQQTVSSVLKKHPEITYKGNRIPPSSPNRYEIPKEVIVSHGTPRQRDEEILKLASPTSRNHLRMPPASPKAAMPHFQQHRTDDVQRNITEREISRQIWLDRERALAVKRLNLLRHEELEHLHDMRNEYSKSQRLIQEAEEKIKTTLQPLLDKAEVISLQDKSREQHYKHSVRKQLGELCADTVMSRGELLADLILDDILTETVEELNRIEREETGEPCQADNSTLEFVLQRLAEFETEEEQIRRRWKKLHYSEIDITSKDTGYGDADGEPNATESVIKPIVFTSAPEREEFSVQQDKQCFYAANPSDKRDSKFKTTGNEKFSVSISPMMSKSIAAYKRAHENYLTRTVSKDFDKFNPWKLAERISDDIVDEIIEDVGKELENFCNDYVEDLYAEEFVENDSLTSEQNTRSFSK